MIECSATHGSSDSDMANPPDQKSPDIATQIMAAMVRMPPKPHEEMKLGKSKGQSGQKNKKPRLK
jgi:hypothetical protein